MMHLRQTGDTGLGVTAVRVMAGIILLVAGIQKWAAGIDGFIGFVTQLGIPAPQVVGPVIAGGEVIGGVPGLVGLPARRVRVWVFFEVPGTSLYVQFGHCARLGCAPLRFMPLAYHLTL